MNDQKLECPCVRLDFPFALTANVEDYKKLIGEQRFDEAVTDMRRILENTNMDKIRQIIRNKDIRIYSDHIIVMLGVTMLDIEELEKKTPSTIFARISKKFNLIKLNRKKSKLCKQIFKSQKIS